MNKFYLGVASAAFVAITSTAFADCVRPPAPSVPDGATASKEEMISANQAVKKFVAETEAYIECVNTEEAAVPEEEVTPEMRESYVTRHNAAVDAMQGVAEQFNGAIRAYKAAAAE